MSTIKRSTVKAIYTSSGIICSDCMTEDDWKDLDQSQIITKQEIVKAEDPVYCDDCGRQLQKIFNTSKT